MTLRRIAYFKDSQKEHKNQMQFSGLLTDKLDKKQNNNELLI